MAILPGCVSRSPVRRVANDRARPVKPAKLIVPEPSGVTLGIVSEGPTSTSKPEASGTFVARSPHDLGGGLSISPTSETNGDETRLAAEREWTSSVGSIATRTAGTVLASFDCPVRRSRRDATTHQV